MTSYNVYLAGPIFHEFPSYVEKWRNSSSEQLKSYGFSVVDPVQLEREDTAKSIVETDLAALRKSSAVLVNATKNVETWGTPMEVFYARTIQVPVFVYSMGRNLSPWLVHHADFITATRTSAIQELCQWKAKRLLKSHDV